MAKTRDVKDLYDKIPQLIPRPLKAVFFAAEA